jgi:hypothetical protein
VKKRTLRAGDLVMGPANFVYLLLYKQESEWTCLVEGISREMHEDYLSTLCFELEDGSRG